MAMLIQFSDIQAAIFWNGALLLALILALFVQWSEIKRLSLDPLSSFVMIAAFNTALLVGSKLGAIDAVSWQGLFQDGAAIHDSGKTIMGGLLLALPVYFRESTPGEYPVQFRWGGVFRQGSNL